MPTVTDALKAVSTLTIDTAPFIYFIERNQAHVDRARAVFQLVDAGDVQAVTSTITLTEVLTVPVRMGDAGLAATYRSRLLNSQNLTMLSVTPEIAERAATIRAQFNLRTPDAIQVATALVAGSEAFLTNDSNFRRVTGIRILILDELDP